MSEALEKIVGTVLIIAAFVYSGPIAWAAQFFAIVGSVMLGDSARRTAMRQAGEQWNAAQVNRLTNVNSTTYARELVLGRVRKGGEIFFHASTAIYNSKFVMCVALASHEIDAVETIYLNDVAVTLDVDGYVQTAPYTSTATISDSATIAAGGTVIVLPHTPLASTVQVTGWTPGSVQDGGGNYYITPTSIVGATVTIPAQTENCIVSYQYSSGASYALIRVLSGSPTQAADARLISLFPTLWTTAHRAQGVAYLICEFDYNETAFATGIPLVTAIVRGAKLYDPRTGLTAWSENPALMARHILQHPNFGRRTSISASEDARIIAAANACDISHAYAHTDTLGVTVTDTVPLYRAATVIPFGTKAASALDDLTQAMAGQWAYAAGEFFIRAGIYNAPVITLTDADLAVSTLDGSGGMPISIATHRAHNDKVNVITCTVYDSTQDYKQTALPPLKATALITRDGVELPQAITMSAVTYAPQSQHIAGVIMRDARDPLTFSAPFKLSAYPVELFDVVRITLADFGWTNKEFLVMGRAWSGEGYIHLTLKETTASIYNPDASFATVGYAANTGLPSPWLIYPPSGITAISDLLRQADGTITTRVLVSWSPILDKAVLDAGFVETQWQLAGATVWQSVPLVSGKQNQVAITGTLDRAAIVIRARCRNSVAVSDWSPQIGIIVTGQTTVPLAATTFTTTPRMFQIALAWSVPTTSRVDLAYTEIWAATSNNRALAARITVVPWPDSGYTHIGLQPGQTWYYWARIVDTSRNASAWYPLGATAGVAGSPSADAGALLVQLNNALGEPQLAAALADRIDTVDWLTLLNAANTAGQDVLSKAGNLLTDATVTTESSTRATADSAAATTVTTLAARVTTAEGGISANVAALSTESSTRAAADSANASTSTTLVARLDTGDYAAVKAESSASVTRLGVVEAKYTIKVDANGRTAGIVLASAPAGTAGSSIVMLADKFLWTIADGLGGFTTPKLALVLGNVNGVPTLGLDGNLIVDGSITARSINGSGLTISNGIGPALGPLGSGTMTGYGAVFYAGGGFAFGTPTNNINYDLSGGVTINGELIANGNIVGKSATEFFSTALFLTDNVWGTYNFNMAHSGDVVAIVSFGFTSSNLSGTYAVYAQIDGQANPDFQTGGLDGTVTINTFNPSGVKLGVGTHTLNVKATQQYANGQHLARVVLLRSYK